MLLSPKMAQGSPGTDSYKSRFADTVSFLNSTYPHTDRPIMRIQIDDIINAFFNFQLN